ncbi:hypothetical protein MTR_8g022760 [Medicago truncatula]|uniref:Uncharacterized protein n=1 Tax=Medicago truncatula TaxID=3880 RepID=G7L936_MEDTR|nr:hypothetical protein MTR_8g022760 [Medicago truncatula]
MWPNGSWRGSDTILEIVVGSNTTPQNQLVSTFSILIWIWSLKTTVVATVVNPIGLQTVATCLLVRGVRGPVWISFEAKTHLIQRYNFMRFSLVLDD